VSNLFNEFVYYGSVSSKPHRLFNSRGHRSLQDFDVESSRLRINLGSEQYPCTLSGARSTKSFELPGGDGSAMMEGSMGAIPTAELRRRKARAAPRAIWPGLACGALVLGAVASTPRISMADEGGVSFWLPGLFGSLAAVPQQPGWALT
jgi:hypothetical protein